MHYSVCGWSVGVKKNTTDTVHIVLLGSDSDVSLLSPGCSPRVSDKEVILAIISSISNSGDSMIKVGSTVLGVENTTAVELEVSISLNRDASWLNGNGCLQLCDTLVWNVGIASGFNKLLGGGGLTFLSSSSVWIVCLELESVVLGIFESPDFKTTVTSLRLWITVNKLLLRELEKFSSGKEMSTFHGSNR